MITNRRGAPLVGLTVLAAALAGGCASPYRTVLYDQTRAVEELAKILASVTDKNSMRAARAELDARFDDFEAIRQRAQKLPPPSEETLQEVRDQGEKLRLALDKVREQVRRIQALPEGPEFLASFGPMKSFLGERSQ